MSDFKNKRDGVRRDGFASSNSGGQANKGPFTAAGRGNNKPGYGNRADGQRRNAGNSRSFNPNFEGRNSDAASRNGKRGGTRPFGPAPWETGASAGGKRGFQKARPYRNSHNAFEDDAPVQRHTGYGRGGQDRTGNTRGHKPFGEGQRNAQGRNFAGNGRAFDTKKRNNSNKRRIDYKEEAYDPNKPIRLNKFIANAGMCARREADKFIAAGVVKVNGEVVTELGRKVLRSDIVHFHDQQIKAEKKIYVLLNKPKGYVTTSEDPQNRKTVLELVRDACMERIYPVGRLDRESMGVLLLTNDGDMAAKLTHPRFLKKKVYHVFLDKNVSAADLHKIAEGITLEDGFVRADAVEYADPKDKKQVGIELHSGKNRIVRRIFQSLGYVVTKLDRVYFAGLTKKNLKRGDWRYLTVEEVNMLRMGSYE